MRCFQGADLWVVSIIFSSSIGCYYIIKTCKKKKKVRWYVYKILHPDKGINSLVIKLKSSTTMAFMLGFLLWAPYFSIRMSSLLEQAFSVLVLLAFAARKFCAGKGNAVPCVWRILFQLLWTTVSLVYKYSTPSPWSREISRPCKFQRQKSIISCFRNTKIFPFPSSPTNTLLHVVSFLKATEN